MPLDLSSPELKSVVLMGMVGMTGGVIYQLASTFIKQSSDAVKLDPETEALQLNSDLLNLFVQLAEFRKFNETAYRKAVIAADELVLRAKNVQSKSIVPCLDDLTEALAMKFDVMKQLRNMSKSATRAGNPRVAAAIEHLTTKVYPELEGCHRVVQQSLH